ncbi:DNA cytosine methyltransferase [Planobispora takensis]|uniref:Cytosine-specific methyltransferase n=1 Tax=Planobispora takensis TaxID=1367882 RepID=A0A8J3WRG4_9ACTN|nr:DNA (cytosine-5-)-methyltransferase [Planobispora takensis]GIH99155.1 hypothetical protein Pta02_11640 [Planobispora takensis]
MSSANLLLPDAPRPGDGVTAPPFLGPWIGSMCTGYGGLDLAVSQAYGARLAWCADSDRHVARILRTRFPAVPNLGDLTAVGWTAVPPVDIVTAGFPCQDISYAGRGAGMRKETRSGLWFTVADALRVLRPGLVILENVPALRSRGLDRVLADLAALGYDTAWACVRASDVGAPHRRERIFISAVHPDRRGDWSRRKAGGSDPSREGLPSADPGRLQPQRRGDDGIVAGAAGTPAAPPGDAPRDRDQAASHPEGERRGEGQRDAHRLEGTPHTAGNRHPAWGAYEQAIRRWEGILGRPAPPAVERGVRGQLRLTARFVEWMMGLPGGWVTDVDLPRTAHMRALGNGVVPQQADRALVVLHRLHQAGQAAGR